MKTSAKHFGLAKHFWPENFSETLLAWKLQRNTLA